MSKPFFPDPLGLREALTPGATAHKLSGSLEQRVAALEQGAANRNRPILFYASMYVANSGAPTNTSDGGWQKVGSGGGTATFVAECDVRPHDAAAQVDVAAKVLTIRQSGMYLVMAKVTFAALTNTSDSRCGVYVNGALIEQEGLTSNDTGGVVARGMASLMELNDGDDLELYGWQDDTASEAYDVSSRQNNRLSVVLVGAAE